MKRPLFKPLLILFYCWLSALHSAHAQEPTAKDARSVGSHNAGTGTQSDDSSSETSHDAPGKRVFGVLPNYRTANASDPYQTLSAQKKLAIASKDSFDYPLVFLAGAFAGLGQWTNQNPSFGQGGIGYAKRLGTSYADQAIGNMLSEGFFPSMLREDPRYFRLGSGSKGSRAIYAMTRIFVTKTDSGGKRFNFSEVVGNATGVAISNLYYPDGRTASNNASKLLQQLGTDAVSQVLKEFWPDIRRKLFRKQSEENR